MSVRELFDRLISECGVEAHLLVDCARAQIPGSATERLEWTQPDWDKVLRIGRRQNMLPMLHRYLQCSDTTPKPVLDHLARHHSDLVRRQLNLCGELARIIKMLSCESIQAIAFKGPVLSAMLYSDVMRRQYHDLDVLVEKKHVDKTVARLKKEGYRRKWHSSRERRIRQVALFRDDDDVAVDVHWEFARNKFPAQLNPDELRSSLSVVTVAGQRIETFAPEQTLILLCINGGKERWKRLDRICDIAALLATYDFNWREVFDLAYRAHAQNILYSGVTLACDLLDAPPTPVPRPSSSGSKRLARLVAEQVCVNETQKPHWRDEFWLMWLSHDRMLGKLEFLLGYARKHAHHAMQPSQADRRLVNFPPSMSFLYYLIRPVRLVVKYARCAWSGWR